MADMTEMAEMAEMTENLTISSVFSTISLIASSIVDDSNSTNITDSTCSDYFTDGANNYDGIPGNLVVNLIAWAAFLVLFTLLRGIGDYGRFGLVNTDHLEERFAYFIE
jgi:hypothetical protein